MKLDEGGCIFGSVLLLRQVGALEQEFTGVREGHADIEYIHRMRVATRRLRATLPLFSDCLPKRRAKRWLKQIRTITAALGEARDADVQIEHLQGFRKTHADDQNRPGLDRLLLRLRQKRASLQPGLTQALDQLAEEQTLSQLRAQLEPIADRADWVDVHTAGLYHHAMQSIGACLDELLAYDAIVADADKVTELHQMRIAAKRLRYTMEAFAPLYSHELKKWLKAVRDAQETLGTIHDCDVWTQLIPVYIEEERQRTAIYLGHTRSFYRLTPGVLAYAAARRSEREGLHVQFNADWKKWQEANLWEKLRAVLSAPLLNESQIYPPAPAETIDQSPEDEPV